MPPLPIPTLQILDLLATAVFAISGSLVAAGARQTMVTFAFFAVATGVGGGTVRDLFIGAPVFWIANPVPLVVCLGAALVVWCTPRGWWAERALEWFDAIGICAYGVYGAAKALEYGVPALPSAVMGVITACLGGIFRDVLAGVPSIVIRPEIYVTAVAAGSGSFVILLSLGVPAAIAAMVAFALAFVVRALAITRGLALPHYER
ncbi:trimeric intracellular cation channel family protein [Mesorhizobium sp. RP14(2022)]|uniref:Trimeric intracellular cation channel family protein n=1 Tax=Mesorhizobium liriopis TaxID=2953882 RepID=A0ABT1C697_9HYPH|nr:trimeric intracellular cation channel family protein [Mesorhizobium liriopis]MCO6050352.1 trimeric intracellular cation channel family protein [Mesorhizobium liriopis]